MSGCRELKHAAVVFRGPHDVRVREVDRPQTTGSVRIDGPWVEPTILAGMRSDTRIAHEESFGPAFSVLTGEDEDDAVRIADDSVHGLAGAVWSTDNGRALRVAERLRSGTVWIDDPHMHNCALPFGGHKQSGVGRELGPRALDEYTEVKHVHLDLSGAPERRVYDLLLSQPPSE